MLSSKTLRSARENGQVVVFFALLLPVLFALGAIVLDVGNWYVHKRHLQTQVDAAVLASAPAFGGCFFDTTGANANIANSALAYAGDTLRDPSTTNLQLAEPNDVRIALNSARYWAQSDGMVPGTNGYGLDNTIATPGDSCSTSYLDAKATDDQVRPLWGLIPLTPSPKTHAKVEIRKVREENGFLPFAVPEIDPQGVFAIFIDDDTGRVVDWQKLGRNQSYDNDFNPSTPFPFSAWTTLAGQEKVCVGCNGTSSRTSVLVLVSKENPDPAMPAVGAFPSVCTSSANKIACYGGSTSQTGLSLIHSYAVNPAGTAAGPQVRGVSLYPVGCDPQSDLSAAYFTLDGPCSARVEAVIDVGVTGNTDPTTYPNCVEIAGMTWDSNVAGGSLFVGTLPIPDDSGRQSVSLSGKRFDRNVSAQNCKGSPDVNYTFPNPVSAAWAANSASGPVQYLKLTAQTFTASCAGTVADANSVPKGKDYCYTVAVGLQQPLILQPATNDPILLRFGNKSNRNNNDTSQNLTGALDCDFQIKLELEVENGCQTFYALNYDDWDKDPATPYTWKDVLCDTYVGSGSPPLPPKTFVTSPTPICVAPKGGTVQDMQKGLHGRFESPCTPNYWPDKNATQAEIDDFVLNNDFANDPRYITLIVTDDTAFTDPNRPVPVKYFGGFYATGWDQGGPQSTGCDRNDQYLINDVRQPLPANLNANDCHPLLSSSTNSPPSRSEPCTIYNKTRDNGDVWGHFVKFVVFSSAGTPSDDLCALTSTSADTCIAVLVE
jgi:hypothetical protein